MRDKALFNKSVKNQGIPLFIVLTGFVIMILGGPIGLISNSITLSWGIFWGGTLVAIIGIYFILYQFLKITIVD